MEPKLIHAGADRMELAQITEFDSFRAEITLCPDETGTWELTMPSLVWMNYRICTGDYIYIEESEWGGPVEQVQHISAEEQVRVSGTCWRDLLDRHIVAPESGSTHVVFNEAEANRVIASLMDGWNDRLFVVSSAGSGCYCSGKLRYVPLRQALDRMLLEAGARLSAVYLGGMAALRAVPLSDLSLTTEFSQDYDARLVSRRNACVCNHILALGSGQMLERQVAEYYLLPNGSLTQSRPANSVMPVVNTLLYDYPSVMDYEELCSAARRKLLSCAESSTLEFSMCSDGEPQLGDLVSVQDTVTGLSGVLSVLATELCIDSSGLSYTHRLGSTAAITG